MCGVLDVIEAAPTKARGSKRWLRHAASRRGDVLVVREDRATSAEDHAEAQNGAIHDRSRSDAGCRKCITRGGGTLPC